MEDAVEKIGYGVFQIRLMAVLGIAWVSTRDPNEISTNISHSNSRVIGPRWFVGNRKKP